MTEQEFLRTFTLVRGNLDHHLLLQFKKWGIQDHPPEKWLVIACEEYGEACKAMLEQNANEYFEELLGLAAVCLQAAQCIWMQSTEKSKAPE